MINQTAQSLKSSLENIRISSELCLTKLQTCLVDYAGKGLPVSEKQAYLEALNKLKATAKIDEILLYTLARPSMQPEAQLLSALPYEVLNAFADDIRQLGYKVTIAP